MHVSVPLSVHFLANWGKTLFCFQCNIYLKLSSLAALQMKRKNWCELVDISSMFPGLLYSDEMESKGMVVPRVVQDELRKPKTNMKEEGSLTSEILEERVKSCDFVLESSSFVLKSSS